MADVNANIGVHINTSAALAELKALQRQLATFHGSIAKGSATSAMAQKSLQSNLLNSINATGKFTAQMGTVRTSTESFTNALEKNKLGMRDYYRFAGASTKTFGRLFKQEFDTINKVSEERVKKMQTQYIKMGRDASGAMKAMAIMPTTLNMKDYGTQTAMAAQRQALFNQLMRQGSTNLLNFGKNTQWAGRQLMVGFTIPLAFLGTTAAKTFMELEKQAVKFRRVYGDMFTTTEDTNKALADIEALAQSFTKYGVEVSKTMEMAASAAAMGEMGANLTAQVAQATRLAVLGGVEQEEALETTISLTNAFGIAAEDLTNKIDFLNSVENQTVVAIEDLTIAIPKAGPVVKQLGGSVEDLAFFLTAMKEGGINASEGANALKSGLASLINPAEKSAKFLADLGININSIVESNAGNIRQTVISFANALDTLDPLNRARAIEQLFGKFQFSRLSTLFQNVTKEGNQASKVLDLAGKSIEELAILSERELKAVEDAVGTNFKAAIEDLKLSLAPIGKEFLKVVTPLLEVVGDLLKRFNNLGDGTKKFIVIGTALVGLIGPVLLMTFGLLANGVANIIKLFLNLRIGFLKLTGNSKILAEQTNYLNIEQLESATVAASLNQAHTTLTQSFTAEASAVRLLRQAYIDATVAAANFARANPGMMMPRSGGANPKKFAKGTAYVPGKGNKDTVASMLTPGEAVIPKDVAQDPRFQPIIDAMISGKLQGFNDGTNNVQPFANSPKFESKLDLSGPSGQVLNTNPSQINRLVSGLPGIQQETNQAFAARSARLLEQMQKRKALTASKLGATLGSVPGTFNFQGVTYKATSQKTAASMVEKINSELTQSKNPGGVGQDKASKTIANRMDDLQKRGKGLSIGTVFKHISGGKSVSGGAGANNPQIAKLRKQINAQVAGSALSRETAKLQIALQSAGLTPQQQQDFLKVQESHILKPTGTKGYADPRKWQAGQVVSDHAGLNNYLNRAGQTNIKSLISSVLSDPTKQQQLGYTNKQVRQLAYDQAFAATGKHPTTAKELQSISRIAKFEVDMHEKGLAKIDKIHQAKGIGALTSVREPAFYKKFYSRVIQLGAKDGLGTAGRVKRGQLDGLSASERRNIARTGLGLITVGKGETLRTADGKDRKVTGQTGVAKPSNVRTRNTSDRRIIPTRGLSSVLPRGRGRLGFMAGANEGYSTQTGASIGSLAESKNLKQSQVRAALEKTSVKEAKRRIAAETKLGKALENQTKETISNNEKAKMFGAKLKGGINVLSGLSIAASFAGGQIGEMAQKIVPFVILLSTLAMLAPGLKAGFMKLSVFLLANPIFAAVAAIGVVIAGMKILDARNKKQAEAQSDYIDQISATTEQMKKVGELTGNVGASEIMARRREGGISDGFGTNFERDGQQFGTTFLSSEVGKSLYETFRTNLEQGGVDAVKQIGLQLSAFVSDGILSGEQANSVARSIGISLSDMTIAADISGELRTLIGPNGEDLTTDPLKVRLDIVESQSGSFNDVLATFAKTYSGKVKKELSASAAALGVQSLEITQSQRDAQSLMYDKQIQSLEKQVLATTDKAKQVALQEQLNALIKKQRIDDGKFATQRQKALTDQITGFAAIKKAGEETAFFNSLNRQVSNKFKGDALVSPFLESAAGTSSKELEVVIKTVVASGVLNPKAATNLIEIFGKGGEAKLQTLLTTTFATQDPGNVQELINIAASFNDKDLALSVITEISSADEKQFVEKLRALDLLQELDGKEINVGLFLKGDANALNTLTPKLEKINKLKGPITLEVIQKLDKDDEGLDLKDFIADYKEYANLPDEVKKKAIQSFITIQQTLSANDKGQAAGLNREIFPNLQAPPPPPDNKKGNVDGDEKKRDTTFDDILINLKRTRDASINATGGAKELMRVLGGKKDLKFFKGLDQQLSKLGANSDFIDFVGGIEKAIQTKLIKVNKAGKASLTELGEATKKAYDEKQLGLFSSASAQAIVELKKQRSGFVSLKAAGAGSAEALEMVADANFAISLSSAKTSREVKKLIQDFRNQRKEAEKTLRATDPQAFLKTQTDIIDQKLDLDERLARRTYEKQTEAAEKQIDLNNKIIEQAERTLEVDKEIGDRKIENINNEIEGLQRRISLEVDSQQDILDSESRILSEDQAVISNTVDLINKKYDEQEKALSKIYEINQDIAEQEKEKLGLADAITQGDISAAAQAAQEITARNAARSGALAQEMLGRARESEIAGVRGGASGKTADEIAARQFQIERQGFALSTQRLTLENQIKIKQEELYQIELKRQDLYKLIRTTQDNSYAQNQIIAKAQEALDKELDIVDVQKNRLKDLEFGIDTARLEGVEFTKELEAALKVLQDMSNLFNGFTSKDLKVTTKQIEDVIKNSGSGSSSTGGFVGTVPVSAAQIAANEKVGATLADLEKTASPWMFGGSQPEKPRFVPTITIGGAPAGYVDTKKKAKEKSALDLVANWRPGGLAMGGIVPKFFAAGGYASGTDTIPAMLTPGEFVVRKNAVDNFGANNLNRINDGMSPGNSVYNYSVNIDVSKSNASSDDIARSVIGQIKYIDSQRIKGQR